MKKIIFTLILLFGIFTYSDTKVTIHYQNVDDLNWDLWVWPKNGNGAAYEFTENDEFGKLAEITLSGDHESVGYIVRLPDWSKKDVEADRFINIENGEAEIWVKSGDENTYYSNPDKEVPVYNEVNFNITYLTDVSNTWFYKLKVTDDKDNTKYYSFSKNDGILTVNDKFIGDNITKLKFEIVRKFLFLEWSVDDVRESSKFDENNSITAIFISEDNKMYKSIEDAKSEKIIKNATIDEMNSITVTTNKNFDFKKQIKRGIEFIGNNTIKEILPLNDNRYTNGLKIIFKDNFDLKNYDMKIKLTNFGEKNLTIGNVVRDKSFDDNYYYDGTLGPIYSKEETEIKVWAPTAKYVNLLIYTNDNIEKLPMELEDKGVYSISLKGDRLNMVYQFEVAIGDDVNITNDPYAYSTTINGEKSVVVNPNILERKGNIAKNPIIYELHIRDLSMYPDNNVKNKGKFLALTEENTKTSKGQLTGISYIKDLGITHIQLLPIYDFSKHSVDETNIFNTYNWGYDPVNYNSVEGSYSTNPYDPNNKIEELQQMINYLHENNIGVIMDVVYNHVFSAYDHAFHKIVPGYYYRYNNEGNLTNGTGVGNDIASERKMVRKYIIDSAKYWAKTFALDGFRFDLMGILDVDTMNELNKAVKEINPNFFILGEGWDMGDFNRDLKAAQYNANKLPNIAFFNDDFRDATKGKTFGGISKGFVSGNLNQEKILFDSIKGGEGVKTYQNPKQLIQYVEAHDNLTLFDQLIKTNDNEDLETITKRHNLATSIVLLSQGTPFIHAGQEFLRTKQGDENSYKSPNHINWLDWERARLNKDSVDLVKELIKIRKSNPSFEYDNFEDVNKNIKLIKAIDQVIAYSQDDLIIIFNARKNDINIDIPNGKYLVLVKDNKANFKGLENIDISNSKVSVSKQSTLVLKKNN